MLANTTMPSSAKGLIHALGSLTDEPITIVHLLSGQVLLEGSSSLTTGVNPPVWVPLGVTLPDFSIDLSECWGGDCGVALGDNILSVFRRGGEGTRDNDI